MHGIGGSWMGIFMTMQAIPSEANLLPLGQEQCLLQDIQLTGLTRHKSMQQSMLEDNLQIGSKEAPTARNMQPSALNWTLRLPEAK